MEQAVCDVCKDIRIGKILIQTNFHTGEPEVSEQRICILLIIYCTFLISVVLFTFTERYKGL